MNLYIECKMGIAGDMLMGALYELLSPAQQNAFLETMNQLFPGDIRVEAQADQKCGIPGTHMHVFVLGHEEHEAKALDHHNHHAHYSYSDILHHISRLSLPESVKKDAKEIYHILGEAEARVHQVELDNIHFHEVGSLDAIADIVGCVLALDYLKPDEIYASPIHVGNGTVHCAHGILPVPAPATAELLKGIPYYTGTINTELCTPTGAAILKFYAKDFVNFSGIVEQIGIGTGTKNFHSANIVRVLQTQSQSADRDTITDISCNLDDMTGEALGHAMEILLNAGAKDVFYVPVQMKKNRPGILLHVICDSIDRDHMIQLILTHTTTRGVRYINMERTKMQSTFEQIVIDGHTIHIKISKLAGSEHVMRKVEYEDAHQYAIAHHISYTEAAEFLLKQYEQLHD